MMQLQNALFVQLFDFIPMKKKGKGGGGGKGEGAANIETTVLVWVALKQKQ